jgi:hypothetical protein
MTRMVDDHDHEHVHEHEHDEDDEEKVMNKVGGTTKVLSVIVESEEGVDASGLPTIDWA